MPAKADFSMFRTVVRSFSTEERKSFFGLLLSKALLVFFDIFGLLALGATISNLTGNSASAHLVNIYLANLGFSLDTNLLLIFVTLLLFIAKGVFSIYFNSRTSHLVAKLETRKSTEYLTKYLEQDLEIKERYSKNYLIQALTDGTSHAFGSTIVAYSIIFGELTLFLAVSIFLLSIDWIAYIAVMSLLFLIAVALSKLVGAKIARLASEAQDSRLKAGEGLVDIQNNLRQIHSIGRSWNYVKQFEIRRGKLANATSKILMLHSVPRYIIEIGLVLAIGVFTLPQVLGLRLSMSPGDLAIFVAGIVRLIAATLPLQNQLNVLRQSREEAQLALDLENLSSPNEFLASQTHNLRKNKKQQPIVVKMDNLTFRYPASDRDTFTGLTCEIPFGSFVAVTGRSGSGKSTFADILLGLRRPSSGVLEFIEDGGTESIRGSTSNMAYVPQRNELFSGTLRQNVALDPLLQGTLEDQRLIQALMRADLGDFVDSLPKGLDTLILKDTSFSGGQIQRIGLARALYSDPRILVVDEVTSALDVQSAQAIQNTLLKLKGQVTVFLIAHQKLMFEEADITLDFDKHPRPNVVITR